MRMTLIHDRVTGAPFLAFLSHRVDGSVKTPSVEPVVTSRLLPKVSSRFLLVLTTLAAVIAAVARVAGEGGALANAAIVALVFIAICFGVFILLFLACWAISSLWCEGESDALEGSPFAEGQLPPQILPPTEQRS